MGTRLVMTMLADLTLDELKAYCQNIGLPNFRASQIYDAIYSGKSLPEVTNLSKEIKSLIENDYPKYKIAKTLISTDGTRKYIIEFSDGQVCESVLMKYKYGNTVCVSTQIGCRMGCKFCASTLKGLLRNLSAGEILGQVLLINRDLGGSIKARQITNIVLMGSGEPLDNYDNVIKFLQLVSYEKGLNISQRNISLSTCGLVDKILMLANEKLNITLTISLHAPNDEIRKSTMPIANRYTIEEVLYACKKYIEATTRRVAIEYTLIKGVNDSRVAANQLAKLLKGMLCHVNLIPLNQVKERSLTGSSRGEAETFKKWLEEEGISVTIRRTMGQDISGACGQLRNDYLGGKL